MINQLLLLVLFCFFLPHAHADREYLDPNRPLPWRLNGSHNQGVFRGQPEQIHLSYGGSPSEMFVTFLTFDDVGPAIVWFGEDRLDRKVRANTSVFTDEGPLKSKRFVHRALLTNIRAGQRYNYRVGSEDFGVSSIFTFRGLQPRPEGGYKYAVFGDMGNYNARSLGRIQREAQDGDFDMILHVGDLAYNLDTDDGNVGDEFMRQIEPIAAILPYQNFSHYKHRFTMPGTDHNLWYSFDLGDVHFVSFSTEVYFNLPLGYEPLKNQWNWLVEDLRKANENRKKVPWIIAQGHRPMYCSTNDSDDCRKIESIIRTGLPILFYEQGVDLLIFAHEHTYERLWPVFNRIVYNGTDNPNVDPPAPVHVLSGSAGCQEYTDTFAERGVWDAVRSSNYGFSRMHVFNATHLHWQQVRADDGAIEDDFWLVKHRHAPYTAADLRRLKRFGTYVSYAVESPIRQPAVDPSEL
ncbi:Purple acid phosphatase [Aphelenchoides fujianensis]|nr:Purple acid phosphatase [Aphelenchoides fujianensis]